MDRQQHVLSRAIAWLFLVGGLSWCLSGAVPRHVLLGWIFVSLSILALLESALWRERFRLFRDTGTFEGFSEPARIERIRLDAEQASRETLWMLVALTLVLASAFGVYVAARGGSSSPGGGARVVVQLSPEFEQALENYLRNSGRPPGNPGAGTGVVGLDPDFQRQLLAALKQPPAPSTGLSWLMAAVIALLAIGAGVGAGLLFSKHPEEAPIAAVTAFAGVIVAAAPRLAGLNGWLLWSATLALIGGGIWIGAFAIFRAPERITESLVVWSVSLCVLGAALACVPHFLHSQPAEPAAQPSKVSETLDVSHLDPVTGFALGAESLPGSHPLAGFAQQLRDHHAKPSDILLLVGSADCTRVNPGSHRTNDMIAQGRAHWIATNLGPGEGLTATTLPHLQEQALPQHSVCASTSDLRAVQAFLIQRHPPQIQPTPTP